MPHAASWSISRWMGVIAARALVLATGGAVAQEPAQAALALRLREIVTGMPRGDRQEVRILTATLKPGDKTPTGGQAFVEPPNTKMTGYNRSATEPSRIVIFYVSDPDTPFLDPAS